MASLLFSYSHRDEALRDQLETHLALLKRQGFIEAWHDRRIAAGGDLHGEISTHLKRADVILLLVSPDFLASDYCYDVEMKQAMQRHEAGEAIVIPVILRPCDWHSAPFGALRAVPMDGKAITLWPNADLAFLDVVTAIKEALTRRGVAPNPPVASGTASSIKTGATGEDTSRAEGWGARQGGGGAKTGEPPWPRKASLGRGASVSTRTTLRMLRSQPT